MKTSVPVNRQKHIYKSREDYYLILQLYNLTKAECNKKEPRLLLNDSRRSIATASVKPQHAGFKNLLLHQLYAIAAPVLKRTTA